MSIQNTLNSCVQICNFSTESGGSGVIVWRDLSNEKAYIATAFHVVEDMQDGAVIDINLRKYTNIIPIILDRSYDFALLEVTGIPTSLPAARLLPSSSNLSPGMNVYVIGWPSLWDMASVSTGCIRSSIWNIIGINQILVSAPILGGNSGGGVFLADSHQCIGLVSWGLNGTETVSGIVPYNVIWEAIMYYSYRFNLVTPSLCAWESYVFGARLLTIDSFMMRYYLNVTNPALNVFSEVGTIVWDVIDNSPATSNGFSYFTINGQQKATFDIIWAIRKQGTTDWRYLNQNRSFDRTLYNMYVTAKHNSRTILTRRKTAADPMDVILPNNLTIQVLTSRVVNDIHDNVYLTKTVTLVKRNNLYQQIGGDPSEIFYEFLSAKHVLEAKKISKEENSKKYINSIIYKLVDKDSKHFIKDVQEQPN